MANVVNSRFHASFILPGMQDAFSSSCQADLRLYGGAVAPVVPAFQAM
jgi:hypothetical protein